MGSWAAEAELEAADGVWDVWSSIASHESSDSVEKSSAEPRGVPDPKAGADTKHDQQITNQK